MGPEFSGPTLGKSYSTPWGLAWRPTGHSSGLGSAGIYLSAVVGWINSSLLDETAEKLAGRLTGRRSAPSTSR